MIPDIICNNVDLERKYFIAEHRLSDIFKKHKIDVIINAAIRKIPAEAVREGFNESLKNAGIIFSGQFFLKNKKLFSYIHFLLDKSLRFSV
jgi:hypothetical protein